MQGIGGRNAGGDVSQAAIALGISRATLQRKMKKLDLQ
ncbi:helix-turn-helix domain-containing protein [Rhizobium johnstonii]